MIRFQIKPEIAILLALAATESIKKPLLDLSDMPGPYPIPQKNHIKGMRTKARVEGRKFFTILGKRRKI